MPIVRPFKFSDSYDDMFRDFWKLLLTDHTAGVQALRNSARLFIETCTRCKTIDQSGASCIALFELYPQQIIAVDKLQWCYENRKDITIEKSRQQGASWICCAFALWVVLFHKDQQVLFTSKKADDVHKLMAVRSLLGKVEYIWENLASQLKLLITAGKTQKELFKLNYLYFPWTDSSIEGAVGGQGARGATANLIINDEFAYNEQQDALIAAVGPASQSNFFVSTLNQPEDAFDRLRRSEALEHIIIDWHDDPRIPDKSLFEKTTREKYGDAYFDKEYDRKYNTEGKMYTFPHSWVDGCVSKAVDEGWNKKETIFGGFDVADMGEDYNELILRQGAKIIHMERWQHKFAHESVTIIIDRCKQYNCKHVAFDEIGVGAGPKSEFHRLSKKKGLPFTAYSVNVGDTPTDAMFYEKPCKDFFFQLRDELHWTLRERIRKTAEGTATRGEMISLPNDAILLRELKYSQYDHQSNRKVKIMSKKELKSQGYCSPNRLDALLLTFAQEPEVEYQKKRAALYGR